MKPPLLLIGHGTHDETGVAEFGRFVHRLRCRLDGLPAEVSGGFITKARPPLSDSISSLVTRGHHHMIAVPLSLTGDRHALGDIPGTLALEQERHPTLEYDLGRPLGPDPRVLELLAERLADARAEMPRFVTEEAPEEIGPAETAVVLVGHGSTDPAVNAEVHRVSRLFWETHAGDLLTVETAYVSHSRPGVPGGLERCRRLGAKRVIVLPYVLFAGAVLERIWAQALAYGANHEGLDIRCAEVIGDCEGLADVVIDRYEEALAGVGLPSADRRNAFDEIDTVPDTEIDTKLDTEIDREIDTEIGAGADSELDREIETEIETEIGSEPMPRPGVPSAV